MPHTMLLEQTVMVIFGADGAVLETWESVPLVGFTNYTALRWGPEAADILIARDGHNWLQPALPEKHR